MYHPDTLLQIAHRREAELVREAQDCGLPQAGSGRARFSAAGAVIVLAITVLFAAARLFIG
jgi:hypothetical protein